MLDPDMPINWSRGPQKILKNTLSTKYLPHEILRAQPAHSPHSRSLVTDPSGQSADLLLQLLPTLATRLLQPDMQALAKAFTVRADIPDLPGPAIKSPRASYYAPPRSNTASSSQGASEGLYPDQLDTFNILSRASLPLRLGLS